MTQTHNFPSLIRNSKTKTQLHQIQAILTTSNLLLPSLTLHNLLINSHSHLHLLQTPPPSTSSRHSFLLYSHLLRSNHLPNPYSLSPLLKSSSFPLLAQLHSHATKLGLSSHLLLLNSFLHSYSSSHLPSSIKLFLHAPTRDVVTYNSMISAFFKCGQWQSAHNLFDEMSVPKDSITWTSMVSGYVSVGRSRDALEVFHTMQHQGVSFDDRTLVSALTACAHLGASEQGEWIHRFLRNRKRSVGVHLGCALIDMYAKCGEMDLGLKVFREMPKRNLLVYTSVVKGLAMHGRGEEALKVFEEMEMCGIVPDDIAFIGVLCACTHAGLVEEGKGLFESMGRKYGVKAKVEHYGCMVDLLARNGLLEEARVLVESMPMEPDARVWGALMAGCRFCNNVELAEYVGERLMKLEKDCSGVYVLLANIYADSDRHNDAKRVRLLMQQEGVEKTPGCSL